MTKAIIIEDEKPACQFLVSRLKVLAPEIEVKATLTDVKQSIEYLSRHAEDIDIIFSDVQLSDGLSFSIFDKMNVNLPVIFITGYDKFMMKAFESNGIDYLMKPVNDDDLQKAINKYKKLEKHFMAGSHHINNLLEYLNLKKRSRLIVKRGAENIFLLLEDVVLFYTENKVVFVIDKNGRKYLADKNLGDLEEDLDKTTFFRANRQYIININYVKSFKTYERVKLQVDLNIENINHCIIISQETAPLFKKWVYEA